MAVDIETLKYIPRERVQSNSLAAVDSAVNKLATRHDAAVEKQSAINEYLGKIKLNSAEDAWKFNKIQEVNNAINQEAEFGNYASALTTAVKKAGDLAASPELLGRMRAQDDYEKFKETVENNRLLDGRTKEWAKEINPYHYEDKYDEKGNIIGGTKWEPTRQPVNQVDMTELMGKALQIAAKDAGGSNTIYYMGADNKLTPDAMKSVDGLPYVNKSGHYEALSKDKLRTAMQAVIANTPGAKESIDQDYEVAKYSIQKNHAANPKMNIANTDITDARGLYLNKDEFLKKKLDPFYKSASYYHGFSEITPGPGQSVAAQRMHATKEATANAANMEPYTPSSVSAGNVETKALTAGEYKSQSYKSRRELISMAAGLGVKVPLTASTDALYNIVVNRLKQKPTLAPGKAGQNILEQAYNAREAYHENISSFNDLISGASTQDRMAAEFVSHLDSGSEIADLIKNNNIYANRYANTINKIYGTKGKAIRYSMDNEKFLDTIKKLDGGIRGSHVKAGFKTGRDANGNMYIELDKNDAFKLHQLSSVINTTNPNMSVVDYNGKTIKSGTEVSGYISDIRDLYNRTNAQYAKVLSTRPSNINNSIESFGDEDIMISDLKRRGLATDENLGKLKFKVEEARNATLKLIRSTDAANYPMYVKDTDGNMFRESTNAATKNVKMDHIKTLLASPEGSKRVNITTGLHNGRVGTLITVAKAPVGASGARSIEGGNGMTFEEGGYSVFLPDLIENSAKNRIESDPEFRAKARLQKAAIDGRSEIRLNDGYSDNPGMKSSKLLLHKNGAIDYMVGGNKMRITKEKAVELQRSIYEYKNIQNYVRTVGAANITPEQKAEIDNTFLRSMYSQLNIPAGTPFEKVPDYAKAIINDAYANLE